MSATAATTENKANTTTTAEGVTCCPPGAPGYVAPPPYVNKGEELKLGDLPVYVVGKGTVGIVVFPEIFGFNSGRLKQNCDLLAEAGFIVAIADYHRGDYFDFAAHGMAGFMAWEKKRPFATTYLNDVNNHMLPLLASRGATKFGVTGNCWGSWPSVKLAATGKFAAAAYCHPSHSRVHAIWGEPFEDLINAIQCPVLSYTAGDDGVESKPDGVEHKIVLAKPFGAKCEYKEFPDVKHGWVSRLELHEPNVARDYPIAWAGVIAWFKRVLLDA